MVAVIRSYQISITVVYVCCGTQCWMIRFQTDFWICRPVPVSWWFVQWWYLSWSCRAAQDRRSFRKVAFGCWCSRWVFFLPFSHRNVKGKLTCVYAEINENEFYYRLNDEKTLKWLSSKVTILFFSMHECMLINNSFLFLSLFSGWLAVVQVWRVCCVFSLPCSGIHFEGRKWQERSLFYALSDMNFNRWSSFFQLNG